MTLSMTRRTFIRIISFTLAIILVAMAMSYFSKKDMLTAQRTLEHQYMKSVDDLVTHTQNINSDLTKVLYTSSPAMLSQISSKVWRETGFAKDIISSLPIEYTKLQNTNKLLSQVGDYCVSLSKSFAQGEPITKEQRDTLIELHKYCDTMTRESMVVADQIRTGTLSLERVEEIAQGEQDIAGNANIAEGFAEFEEGFTAYPTLIYDGPFSDHIMQKEAELLKTAKDVNRDYALDRASQATGIPKASFEDGEDEKSKMECYNFIADGVTVSVTKKAGLISSILKSRMVESSKLSTDQAIAKAETQLKAMGIENMQKTYFEISNNIMTINYAYSKDDVLYYTDLIKISVALDNGEITGFDSRGYIINHKPRSYEPPKYSAEQAQSVVSQYLTVNSSELCLIPSGGLNETLCYEYKCKSDDGKEILVYVNANNKIEEQILILLIDENGTLTI